MRRAKVTVNSHSTNETKLQSSRQIARVQILKVVKRRFGWSWKVLGTHRDDAMSPNPLMSREKNVFVFDPEPVFQVTNPPTFSNN